MALGTQLPWNPAGTRCGSLDAQTLQDVASKASEVTPLGWAAAIEGWKAIGAPDVLDAVTGRGEAGAAVVEAVDMIQFTGSVDR